MDKIIEYFTKDDKNSDLKAMFLALLCLSAFLILFGLVSKFILMPAWNSNHQDRLNKLNEQLLEAENAEETAVVNVMINMENDDWQKQIEANHTVCALSFCSPVLLMALFIIYVFLSKVMSLLFDKILGT